MTVYIYGLKCPLSDEIRYIGKAVNVERRYREHVYSFRRENSYKANWIADLHKVGLRPSLVVLHELDDGEDWESVEREEIAVRSRGGRLTNLCAGGEGVPLLSAEDEAKRIERTKEAWGDEALREAHSLRLRAAFAEPEAKARKSKSAKEAWRDPASRARRIASLSAAASTPENKRRVAKRTLELFADEEFRGRHREACVDAANRPGVAEQKSQTMAAEWAGAGRLAREETMRSPVVRTKMAASAAARWADPEKREAALAALHSPDAVAKKMAKIKDRATPEYRAMMAEKTRLSWEKRRQLK